MSDISEPRRPPAEEKRETHWRDIIVALLAVGIVFFAWMDRPGIEIPLAAGGGAVMVVLAFARPAVPCMLFVIFSFLRIHEAFPFMVTWRIPQLLAQLSLLVIFWHLVLARSMRPFWTRELILFASFFGVITLGIATSTSWEDSYLQWSDVFVKIAVIVIVLAWSTRSAGDFQLIARLLTGSGIAVAYVALYNQYQGIGLVEGTRVTIGRADGSVLGDPNDLSLALLFPLSFAGALLLGRVNFFDRMLGLAGCITIFFGILATQSRGGLLGLAAVCAILASRFIKSRAMLISIGVAAVFLLFVVAGIGGRSSGGEGQGIDESSQGRLNAWGTAFNMAVHRPLTGVGLGNFTANYWTYTDEWDGKPHAVHSSWFLVLAETGFPGLALFLTLVGSTALMSWRCIRIVTTTEVDPRLHTAAYALAAGLGGYCVSGTFLTQGFTWPFYIILALAVALHKVLTDQKQRDTFLLQGMSPLVRNSLPSGPT
ncbi:O-antigen ligase family protein [Aquabacter cavernae]|uniref:O-antigen ligase family protein n=1 Tax=Aquabacter cavernae TaxID=2496029 RepID=UPI0013DE8422|nr:O-antigen ligase family protein [Aquabacter cavernae]